MKSSLAALFLGALISIEAVAQVDVEKIASTAEAESKVATQFVSSVVKLESDSKNNIDLRLVIVDYGLSTDVSPRFHVFLAYYHAGEMNNTYTAFDLGRFVTVDFVKWKKPVSGYYALRVMQPDLQPYMIYVDARKVFADDKALELEEFEDKYFASEITVTRK